MAARKIGSYLDSMSNLRRLTDEVRRLTELQRIFVKIAPQPLTHGCCIRQLRAGILVLSADNAAIAAKLKQIAPRLLTSCRKQGLEVTSIRVEVQVTETVRQPVGAPGRRRLSLETIENLEHLAAGLEDSPLKQALARLAARQRGLR